ncbi:hypothetical protein PSAC2689_190128 [Paraburkholderia sacchari]
MLAAARGRAMSDGAGQMEARSRVPEPHRSRDVLADPRAAQQQQAGLADFHGEMLAHVRIRLLRVDAELRALNGREAHHVIVRRFEREILREIVGKHLGIDVAILVLDRLALFVVHDARMKRRPGVEFERGDGSRVLARFQREHVRRMAMAARGDFIGDVADLQDRRFVLARRDIGARAAHAVQYAFGHELAQRARDGHARDTELLDHLRLGGHDVARLERAAFDLGEDVALDLFVCGQRRAARRLVLHNRHLEMGGRTARLSAWLRTSAALVHCQPDRGTLYRQQWVAPRVLVHTFADAARGTARAWARAKIGGSPSRRRRPNGNPMATRRRSRARARASRNP